MKIVLICTNYGSFKDGIGHYSYNLINEIKKKYSISIKYITGNTIGLDGIKKIKSKVMIRAIDEFLKKESNIDKETFFIIEYPFLEWNPLVILSIIKLRKKCIKNNAKIILSIHEYMRISSLRRYFTNLLIYLSDAIMVTDQHTLNEVKKFKKPVLVRPIPSNILKVCDSKKEENTFCFFGLINKSKSFNEMIKAWKNFNKENKYRLNIYTSSEISIDKYANINIYKNLDDKTLSKELSKCKYAILPINPSIALNNGTLKAVAQHGCLPIGIFGEKKLEDIGVAISDSKYSIKNIEQSLYKAIKLDVREYNKKLEGLLNFGEQFSFSNNAKIIIEFINKI